MQRTFAPGWAFPTSVPFPLQGREKPDDSFYEPSRAPFLLLHANFLFIKRCEKPDYRRLFSLLRALFRIATNCLDVKGRRAEPGAGRCLSWEPSQGMGRRTWRTTRPCSLSLRLTFSIFSPKNLNKLRVQFKKHRKENFAHLD